LLVVCSLCITAYAQDQQPDQVGDVIRINTNLVQTDVTVVDKQGRFVEGLKAEQFELRVDGKPQPISSLDRVTAGTAKEARLARRGATNLPEVEAGRPSYRGRTIIFFIDDLHLSLQSLDRTRQMLVHFLDKEMGNHDRVAIASASGQIGFLQQFTDNKAVLRAALARLNYHPYNISGYGGGSSRMSEYMALTIDSKADEKVTNFYIEECMKQAQPAKDARSYAVMRHSCEVQVKGSARAILLQAAQITANTYDSLETLIRSSQRLPGRKLAFFVSDGFLLETGQRGPALLQKLQKITDAALRVGVVIYTIDAKGLVSGALDATNSVPVDANGRLESALLREVAASQDALMALADETGGRALRNRNVFDNWVSAALEETSNYYRLAWRPETEEQRDEKFRKVEVSIAGRPDLTVRLPRGFLNGSKALAAVIKTSGSANEKVEANRTASGPDVELRDALTDFYTRDTLPTLLSVSYLNTPNNGTVLTASTEVANSAISFGPDGQQPAAIDLAGVVLNDKGKIVSSFRNHLTVNPLATDPEHHQPGTGGIIYNYKAAQLSPGIYQVRVAARDAASGRVGSAVEWIEIPDLSNNHLTLSSLLIGAQVMETSKSAETSAQSVPRVQFSVDRRFARSSHLGFWIFIYNAARKAGGAPSLTAQVQVFREGQVVVNTQPRQLKTETMADLARIPYGGDFALNSLVQGSYELRVTITDQLTNTTASQTVSFVVE
jgi:VWFA-related protein